MKEPPCVPNVRVVGLAKEQQKRSLTWRARVRDPSGVAWVRLEYRGVTQSQDCRTSEMAPQGDCFTAAAPGEHLKSTFDFMYVFEVMGRCGNSAIYPDFELTAPYIVVRLVS